MPEKMVVEYLPLADLLARTNPKNPRKISPVDLQNLERSMSAFGVVEPVVLNARTGRIVGGHQRVQAAHALGLEAMPVVRVDLDEAQEHQLNLALNRIHGDWDDEKLGALLLELQQSGADLALTGFTDAEVDRALALLASTPEGETDPDEVPLPPDEPATQRGDRIVLGNHVLFCGDSSSTEDLDALLAGEKIHLLNTDPPYNVRVEPRSNNAIAAGIARAAGDSDPLPRQKKRRTEHHHQGFDLARDRQKGTPTGQMRARDRVLENDFLPEAEFEARLASWFMNASRVMVPGSSVYIWGGYANVANYPPALKRAQFYFSQAIIWDKQWPVLTRKDFMGAHEWCFYGWKEGGAHRWFGPTNAQDIWRVKKVAPPAMVHLTEKPVELAELALSYSSQAGENVLDIFGGSGSTLIAAERMGRRAFLMEIDPAYCDVIVQRWTNFTGKKAEGWRGTSSFAPSNEVEKKEVPTPASPGEA